MHKFSPNTNMEKSILPTKPIPQIAPLVKQQQQISTHFSSKQTTESHLIHLCKNGKLKEAVLGLDTITKHGHKLTPNTYISLLDFCINSNSMQQGRLLHSQIKDNHHLVENPFVMTKLVSMYAKCGSLEDARRVFDGMCERRNLFTWSALIGGYSREQRWREIVELFFLMMQEGITLPDEILVTKFLQACANIRDVETGKIIHSLVIRSGLGLDSPCVRVCNSLLSMYAKYGDLRSARKCFEKMEYKDRVTWNSLISGYCRRGENEEAMRLFDQMQAEGVEPGLITWNTLIACYIQCGCCDLAMQLMRKMRDSHGITPDVFTWTSMISGLTQNNRKHQALELFRDMLLARVQPNGVTIASALSACSSFKALNKGRELHSVGIKIGTMSDVLVGNSLIEMYCKCGKVEAARNIFDTVVEKDIFTWNSMIGGYTRAGYCGKAYDLFVRMKESGIHPNVVTWNVMISGYIQKGDEDQAMVLFHKMETDGMTRPNAASWNLLISGLLQNGQKNKAFRIFRQMQSCCNEPPNSITMLSILPACANLVAAKKVKEIHCCTLRRLRLELDLSVANSLINSYAKSGDIVSARAIFENLPNRDVISWNIIIACYVFHGCPNIALDLFDRMQMDGVKPSRGTFGSVILAYSLAGMVEHGKDIFSSMIKGDQVSPSSVHCLAMVDLLGRSGRLEEAIEFIEDRNVGQLDSTVWDVLLTACRVHGNVRLAIVAAERKFERHPRNSLVYRLLLQLYSLNGMPENVSRIKKHKKGNLIENSPGCTWIEVKNRVHTFITGDCSDSCLHAQLESIQEEIKKVVPSPNYCEREAQICVEEEDKEEISGIHSEKLAISLALISSHCTSKSIRIIRNFRICGECHKIAKLVSLKYGREIYLYDSKCLHHFKSGQCSCRDYW